MKIPKLLRLLAVPIAAVALIALSLPSLLSAAGLHPKYSGPKSAVPLGRALIVTTSRDTLGDTGKKTGVYASEMTVPYYAFLDGGMTVDVASIQGGKIPIEPVSLRWPLRTREDSRFLKDEGFKQQVEASLKIDGVDFTKYDIVFMAGGWGAAYDLGFSDVLGAKITEANAANAVLGSVCHGALGFLKARDTSGAPLVKGRKMTGVSDKQVRELRISITPQHPERELRAAGALYESETAFLDIFAGHVVIDGNIVTGQNQNDGAETAQLLMEKAAKRGKK
ncbi:MAG: type 1 glutamine amidotransferase domain-containing protein [Treponemataceae bacterium]